jgi:hypothetical protein
MPFVKIRRITGSKPEQVFTEQCSFRLWTKYPPPFKGTVHKHEILVLMCRPHNYSKDIFRSQEFYKKKLNWIT